MFTQDEKNILRQALRQYKTMADIHKEIVEEIKARGETDIFNPTQRSFLDQSGPDVYVKGRTFPSVDFISGAAVRDRDGTISIVQDHFTYHSGFTIDQLGLCDPVLWYENLNLLRAEKTANICPCCGK